MFRYNASISYPLLPNNYPTNSPMASITPTDSGYRAQIYVKGVRDSASFRTKREANAWASARETEIRECANTAPASRYTLGEAMGKYGEEVSPTKRGEAFEIKRMKAWRKDPAFPLEMKIGDVKPENIAAWRDSRSKVVSAGSIIRDMTLLSSVFESARREWRWVESNPVRDVRKPRSPDHRDVTITRVQIRLMLEAMGYCRGNVRMVSQSCAAAFLFALRTGMRAGEICALTWDDVFPTFCKVRAIASGAGKTGKRDVPLTPQARALIESMRGYDPVFVFGLKTQSLDANFRKYRKRAGISGFTFHDSRHTAATWISRKLDVLDLCKMFGWRSTSMALTYYNPSANDIAKRLSPR